ncbi:hypothetical protein Emin_1080 [Elusimicrobium minutum Pei191]|uniref:Uncharacterized protein n=1 Tax=Elusimicrobium minutum (strain Pei191) TaxID=445932 RepID=B2KDN6_ELUMP|nr:hypothetical protein [Elusimicrobium minutum]ACC98632.1 hypothetical protein Emin_1080 [Elusimicrobium minutum Pei191]
MHIFIDRKKIKINILGQDIEIKPFTLKQTICLGSLIGGVFNEVSKDKNGNFILKIIKASSEKDAGRIINILSNFALDENCPIAESITMQELSLLIKTITEVNNFEEICANFKSAFEKLKI